MKYVGILLLLLGSVSFACEGHDKSAGNSSDEDTYTSQIASTTAAADQERPEEPE